MSYINLSVFKKSQLLFSDLIFLSAINQVETEWLLENLNEDTYKRFEELGLIKHINKKSVKEYLYVSLRVSDKGKKLLSDLEEPECEEQDEQVFNWLKDKYLSLGKSIGNGAKTKRLIRDFRIKSDIQKNNLLRLVLDFLAENEDRSNRLEYIFYYPKNAFDTKFNLDGSWLWNHYEKNKERLDKTFEQY